ncbi:MAG TPA: hypothetical protein PKA07_11265, partial [Micropruina sp.]|nr:hypothetical protein [Micropruina sp.]
MSQRCSRLQGQPQAERLPHPFGAPEARAQPVGDADHEAVAHAPSEADAQPHPQRAAVEEAASHADGHRLPHTDGHRLPHTDADTDTGADQRPARRTHVRAAGAPHQRPDTGTPAVPDADPVPDVDPEPDADPEPDVDAPDRSAEAQPPAHP